MDIASASQTHTSGAHTTMTYTIQFQMNLNLKMDNADYVCMHVYRMCVYTGHTQHTIYVCIMESHMQNWHAEMKQRLQCLGADEPTVGIA